MKKAVPRHNMRILDKKFRRHVGKYVFQSVLASLAIVVVLSLLSVSAQSAIIASLGASCFIAFTMPKLNISKPRYLVGGYVVGVVSGVVCHYLLPLTSPSMIALGTATIIFGGLSVGLAIFLMVITDTEHPPAAGVALGLVINPWDYLTIIFILVAIGVLSAIKWALKPVMMDLL